MLLFLEFGSEEFGNVLPVVDGVAGEVPLHRGAKPDDPFHGGLGGLGIDHGDLVDAAEMRVEVVVGGLHGPVGETGVPEADAGLAIGDTVDQETIGRGTSGDLGDVVEEAHRVPCSSGQRPGSGLTFTSKDSTDL